MKRSFSFLFFLFSQIVGLAQYQSKVDSLEALLPELTGEEKVNILTDLCYYNSYINFDQAVLYGEQAVALASEIGYRAGLGNSYNDLSTIYRRAGRYELSLDYAFKALLIFEETKDERRISAVMHNIGGIYANKGDYAQAMEHLLKALDLKNKLGGYKIGSTLSGIGEVYRARKNYDKALEYYFQALEENKKNGDKDGTSAVLNNIEIIYRKRGQFDKALEYRMEVIELDKKMGDDYGLAVSYNNLGELYSAQNKLDDAVKYFEKSLEIKEKMNNQKGITHTTEELSLVYAKLGHFEKADEFAQKGLAIAKQIGSRKRELDILLTLSQVYQSFGLYQQALAYHIDYSSLKDSIFNEGKQTIIADMETKYQTSRKEAENQLLMLQSEQQAAIIEQKNLLVTLILAGLSLFVLLSVLLYKTNRQKTRNNQLLATQKEELIHLNTTKNRFFGIIAHDLRGPVTALQGITGLLNYNIRKGKISNLNKIARQIEESAVKVNALLDNLLKWALSQEGTIPYRPQTLALKPLVKECLGYFSDMASTKGITLSADIPDDLHVCADKEMLSTVLRNLVNNSIKFTPDGGLVKLSARNGQSHVQIEVADNGRGIEEEKMEKLFLLDDSKTSEGTNAEKGTGLGLVLVNDLVRLNQGTIRVDSKVSKGSVFAITLPSQLAMAG